MSELQKIAVVIDADNTQLSKMADILREISTRGRIVVKRAYGNWRKDTLKNWETPIKGLAIKAEQQFDYVSGKNATDMALVIDTIELLHTNIYDAFVIVSSDSDYTPLVGRLKSMGKFVLGISRSEAASTVFINACNEFQFLEGVSGRTVAPAAPKKHRASTEEAADEAELNKLIVSILEESADTDGMYASELKGILLRLRPDFNEKSYGCSSFGKLILRSVKSGYDVNISAFKIDGFTRSNPPSLYACSCLQIRFRRSMM